eukprot:jgi/Chrzof1/5667/Cz16g11010.t1
MPDWMCRHKSAAVPSQLQSRWSFGLVDARWGNTTLKRVCHGLKRLVTAYQPCDRLEDTMLMTLVEKFGEKRWNQVAAGLPGRTGKGCSHRWRTYLRPDVKHPHLEPFTEWEAAVIVQSQKEYGNNWLGKQDQTSTVLQ